MALAVTTAVCGTARVANAAGSDATETVQSIPSDVDHEGVLRIGSSLTSPIGIHLDPTLSAVITDQNWMELVFGTLLRQSPDGTIEPWLAADYEIIDDQTLSLTIQEGVTFSDGSAYDAEAVRAGLLRTLNEASEPTVASQSLAFKAISEIVVDGSLELTITLSSPDVGALVASLADREGAIVSPTQAESAPEDIDRVPIGAGPYLVEEFIPEQTVSLRKNPDFFDADSWLLGGIDYVGVSEVSAQVNGLRSGDLDYVAAVPIAEAAAFEGTDVEIIPVTSDRSYVILNPCSGKPPFDDPEVRSALSLAIDRQQLIDLAYNGTAEPADALWPAGHPYFNPDLEGSSGTDPDEARRIFEEAGVTSFELWYVPGAPATAARLGEVIQAQLDAVGVTVTLHGSTDIVSEFILPESPGVMLIPGSRTGVDKYDRVFAEGQVQALCGVSHPEIVDVVSDARSLAPGDQAAAELFQEADAMIADGSLVVPLIFAPTLKALNTSRIGGEPAFRPSPFGGDLMYDSIYVRA